MSPCVVYAQFDGKDILLEQGRMVFALLHAFSRAGCAIELRHRFAAPLGKYGELARGLAGVTLVDGLPAETAPRILLCDGKDGHLRSHRWRKAITVKFDVFSPYWFAAPVIMPYPMHPLQAGVDEGRLAALRATARRIRVFFSGDSKGYVRRWIDYPAPKMPRQEVLRTLLDCGDEDVVLLSDGAALHGPGSDRFSGKCVIGDPQGCWIATDEWLPTLAMSDFFLGPPGIVMPMCHNLVEAMAVGTIPVTSYPEWFSPPLRHLENCLVFAGRDDLLAKVRLAMRMPADELSRLRAGATTYYDQWLRPEGFVRRVRQHPGRKLTVLMHAERNTSAHAKRLGRSAILFDGGGGDWRRRLLRR
jgi:hypothetical protein